MLNSNGVTTLRNSMNNTADLTEKPSTTVKVGLGSKGGPAVGAPVRSVEKAVVVRRVTGDRAE